MAETRTKFIVGEEQPTIAMEREFTAPRELVYKAVTDPEQVRQWYGGPGLALASVEIDARPGGALRIAYHTDDGEEHLWSGEFHEVVPDERLTYTSFVDQAPESRSLSTDVLEDRGGSTLYLSTMEFPTFEARDGYLSGMGGDQAVEGDAPGGDPLDRLAEYLATLP